jgi:hypothetical protein
MSVYSAPVQVGGASVLAASAVKTGGIAVVKGSGALAATGAHLLQSLTAVGLTALAVGRLLMHRGRGTVVGTASFD